MSQRPDFMDGIIVFLTAGGGIATGLTIANNWLIKRRQHKLNMSDVRIQTISKFSPLYNKLALYNSWNLSNQLNLPREKRDTVLMFFYVCNILNLRRQIVNQIGDLQFADLTAETIIGDLGRNIASLIVAQFGQYKSSLMTSLVDSDLPFYEFHDTILKEHSDLLHDFEEWITRPEISEQLEKNCRWYSQLIMYELNYVYMIWYGEPPDLLKLSPDLIDHLETTHPKYFQRLKKIECGSLL